MHSHRVLRGHLEVLDELVHLVAASDASGLPWSSDNAAAICGRRWRTMAATSLSTADRSNADRAAQEVAASRALRTAWSTSAPPAWDRVANTFPELGLVASARPPPPERQQPSTKMRRSSAGIP